MSQNDWEFVEALPDVIEGVPVAIYHLRPQSGSTKLNSLPDRKMRTTYDSMRSIFTRRIRRPITD